MKDKEFADRIGLPTTIEEMAHIIKKINGWNYCAGGPPITCGKKARLEAAYKDGGTWRHKNCAYLLENGTSCMKCLSVQELLRKKFDRENAPNLD